MDPTFSALQKNVIACRKCPRLVTFRETAPKRKSFEHETFWRKPVPGFGDPNAWLLILGLAPAAQGANRTGRIFTGDPSGRFLFSALYKAGLANQPLSESRKDGLKLRGCYITAAVKCVPPQNRPAAAECKNCFPFFENELALLKNLRVVLGLGKTGFDTYQSFLQARGVLNKRVPFTHGAHLSVGEGWPDLYGAFHPSPQNTYTGKLTEKMFLGLVEEIKGKI